MNYSYQQLLIYIVLGMSLAGQRVYAVENNLQFSGTLVAEPCSLDPASAELHVNFETVTTANLYHNSRTPGKPLVITLLDCDTSTKDAVTFTFTGTESSALPGLLKVNGPAGIAIGMETQDGSALPFNKPTPGLPMVSGDNSYTLLSYVQGEPDAIANRTITAGDFTATATFEIDYP